MADHQVHDLTPEEVSNGMTDGRYLLVDVREPNEVAVEAYPGGVVVPLSTFDPAAIPDPQGKTVVFACRSGKRSVTASLAARPAACAASDAVTERLPERQANTTVLPLGSGIADGSKDCSGTTTASG